jgi:hypothetical protein
MNESNSVPLDQNAHRGALAALLRAIFGIHQDHADLVRALQHVDSCQTCRHSLAELSASLTDILPEQLHDQDFMKTDAEQLVRLFDRAAQRDLEQMFEASALSRYPDFGQWRMLQKTGSRTIPEHGTKLRRGAGYLAWLTAGIREQVVAVLITLRDMFEQAPAPVLARRGLAEEALVSFDLMDIPQLQAQLTVYPDRTSTQLCWAVVEVAIPDRWPDSSGVEVVMRLPDREERKRTGADGQVVFQDIPRRDLSRASVLLAMPPEPDRPAG